MLTLQKDKSIWCPEGNWHDYILPYKKSVIGQVLILAASAIIIGLGLTYGVSTLLPDSMPFVLSNNTILQYTAILLMVSMLGASLSLLQITRIDAIEAIGRAEA
ncbi:hypothetical protein GCM10020331_004990 [Ectobacillus funiculus]